MSLSFLAYNKLHRDTYLAVSENQVQPNLSQTKQEEYRGRKWKKIQEVSIVA